MFGHVCLKRSAVSQLAVLRHQAIVVAKQPQLAVAEQRLLSATVVVLQADVEVLQPVVVVVVHKR